MLAEGELVEGLGCLVSIYDVEYIWLIEDGEYGVRVTSVKEAHADVSIGCRGRFWRSAGGHLVDAGVVNCRTTWRYSTRGSLCVERTRSGC